MNTLIAHPLINLTPEQFETLKKYPTSTGFRHYQSQLHRLDGYAVHYYQGMLCLASIRFQMDSVKVIEDFNQFVTELESTMLLEML